MFPSLPTDPLYDALCAYLATVTTISSEVTPTLSEVFANTPERLEALYEAMSGVCCDDDENLELP